MTSRINPTMAKVKKSITIDEKLDKKLQEHNKKYGSKDSGVISLSLEQFFKKQK